MQAEQGITLQVGANWQFLNENFSTKRSLQQEKQIFVLEGGSGSAKTWDALQWIMNYCQMFQGWNKDILIGRDQYSDCSKTVMKDFFKILKLYEIYEIKKHKRSHPEAYELYGNMIYFSGLEGLGSHGERHDVLYINEIMECDWEDVRQLNQRCNEVLLCDYNPAYTDHWVYDKLIPRPDCLYFHSTQLMNPFLPKGQRDEILAYEPTHPKDRKLLKKDRRPHALNIVNGTADDYMWEVYGLGNRAKMEGLIFPHIEYIDEFPAMGYHYGMDFGWTVDPTTIVKHTENAKNIFLELLCYEPIETPETLFNYMLAKKVNVTLPITADSSDKYTGENKGTVEMVKSLRQMGLNIQKVSKTKSVMFWLNSMKKKKVHIVRNELFHYARKEAENYHMKTINNIAINQPIDSYNHFFDGARYAHMAWNNPRQKGFW